MAQARRRLGHSWRLLVVVTSLSAYGSAEGRLKNTRIVHHEVRPLERTEIHELLCARLLVNKVQQEVVDTVFDRTSGNALYCIELANTMHQKGVLKVSNNVCNLSIPLEELDTIGLPNSLHAAMSTQLDRLSVQCAACEGGECDGHAVPRCCALCSYRRPRRSV